VSFNVNFKTSSSLTKSAFVGVGTVYKQNCYIMIRFLTTDFSLRVQRINITATSANVKSALRCSADCNKPHKRRTEGDYENKSHLYILQRSTSYHSKSTS